MSIRHVFTATLPSLILLAALVGALTALAFPSSHVARLPAPAAAATPGASDEIRPAIYTSGENSPDAQEAWTQLVATFELVRSSQAVLEEAQSLRAIAAALAAGPTEPRADRQRPEANAAAAERDRAHRELAEGQLALADKVLRAAEAHAANTQAAFGVAWQNVQRASQENTWQDPTEPMRQSALHRRRPG
jgi:hypothetical protein